MSGIVGHVVEIVEHVSICIGKLFWEIRKFEPTSHSREFHWRNNSNRSWEGDTEIVFGTCLSFVSSSDCTGDGCLVLEPRASDLKPIKRKIKYMLKFFELENCALVRHCGVLTRGCATLPQDRRFAPFVLVHCLLDPWRVPEASCPGKWSSTAIPGAVPVAHFHVQNPDLLWCRWEHFARLKHHWLDVIVLRLCFSVCVQSCLRFLRCVCVSRCVSRCAVSVSVSVSVVWRVLCLVCCGVVVLCCVLLCVVVCCCVCVVLCCVLCVVCCVCVVCVFCVLLSWVTLYPFPFSLTLYPLPFTPYPFPFFLYPLPFVLFPLSFVLYRLPFAFCPLPFALCPLPFVLLSFTVCLLPVTIWLLPFGFCPLPLAFTFFPLCCVMCVVLLFCGVVVVLLCVMSCVLRCVVLCVVVALLCVLFGVVCGVSCDVLDCLCGAHNQNAHLTWNKRRKACTILICSDEWDAQAPHPEDPRSQEESSDCLRQKQEQLNSAKE